MHRYSASRGNFKRRSMGRSPHGSEGRIGCRPPSLPEGRSTVPVSLGRFSLDVYVRKTKTSPTNQGKFLPAVLILANRDQN